MAEKSAWKSGWTIPNEMSWTTRFIAFILVVFGALILWQPTLLFYLFGIMLLVIGFVGMADDRKPAIIELLFGILIFASLFYMPEYTVWLTALYFVLLGIVTMATSDNYIGVVAGVLMLVAGALFILMPIWFALTVGIALLIIGSYYLMEGYRDL